MKNRRVLRPIVTGIALISAAACSDPGGVDISGDCDLVVHVNTIVYAVNSELEVPQDFTPSEAHATVVAQKDCADVAVDGVPLGDPLQDGESTFLPAGSPLYPITGFDVTERLAAEWDGGWVVLADKQL